MEINPIDTMDMEIPEHIKDEVILLYNLGVGIDDLKYFLSMKLHKVI